MDFIHSIDIRIISYVNSFVGRSETFDHIISSLTSIPTIKGGVVAALLFYAWLAPDRRLSSSRAVFAHSVVGITAAVAAARALQRVLPFSFRPKHDPVLDFALPASSNPDVLAGWSSFPSDHAVLYFAVATAIFFADRSAGIFAYVWTTLFTCLPRIYVGFHYPSDIIAGAALGVFIMWLVLRMPLPTAISNLLRNWEDRNALSLFVMAFLFAFQVATVFSEARYVMQLGFRALTGTNIF